jgi:pSer/pThr/pTyr-binding forkhead associated (FHA) protein
VAGTLLALRFLLAALLYAFLGGLFYVLWKDLRRGEEERPPEPPLARLVATEEGDGRVTRLNALTAVGRAADNTVVLDDPFASSHHALLLWREGQWWLEDLESHNGTFLNGHAIDAPTRLTPGDTIRVGETTFRFEREA